MRENTRRPRPRAGNELDAISIAAKAALADVKIPKVTIVPGASADEPAELELDDDPGVAVRLDVREAPVLVTVSKCGKHYIVDPTSEEQTHVDSAVTLAVTEEGAVRGAANRGAAGLPAAAAQEMVRGGEGAPAPMRSLFRRRCAAGETEETVAARADASALFVSRCVRQMALARRTGVTLQKKLRKFLLTAESGEARQE